MWDDGTIIAVHKPRGPSSNQIVVRIKKLSGIARVGHAGTLDPLASGVLVVGIGRSATKQLWDKKFESKEYRAEIFFGETSTTDDLAGEKTVRSVNKIPTRAEVESALEKFVGTIEQRPPLFSALKISGQPAYKLARRGKIVELKSRSVTIESITLLAYEWPRAHVHVVCKSGVYIRSLVRDTGDALGVGAYMSDLVRTRVGPYSLEDAQLL